MAIDQDMLNEIESEKKYAAELAAEAKARKASGGGNAGFFMLKDGEKAMVRPLRNGFKSIFHHSLWNQGTRHFDVQAICAQSVDLSKEFCVHCQKAEETKTRKLVATKQFVVPMWLYGVRDVKTGTVKTYKDKDGEEHPVRGLRYALFKVGDPIFENLLTMYKMAGDITLRDITIEQTGSGLDKDYDINPLDPTPFKVDATLPEFTPESIVDWIAEKNPPALIENPNNGVSSGNTAQPASAGKASNNVPEF